jgi:transposase
MEYHIKQEEWEVIFKKLQIIKGIHVTNQGQTRKFIEGVWCIARSGCQWRLLPKMYGGWRAVHMRFKYWSNKGVWRTIFNLVVDQPDMEAVMIDATIVRAHACSAGYKKGSQDQECLGRSKGGFTTKIHTLVDALGNPLKFILTPGQRNDITQAESLVKDLKELWS